MKINCLETAKKAYRKDIDEQDIVALHDALATHAATAKNSVANLVDDMNKFSANLADAHELAVKRDLLQTVYKGQVIVDGLARIQDFVDAGHTVQNAVPRALEAKMVGTTWKVKGSGDNTYTRQGMATDKFYRDFAGDIQGELLPIFGSETGQVEIVQGMMDVMNGKAPKTMYEKMGAVFVKYQNMYHDAAKGVGIFISKLDNRVAPNIHNPEKILRMTRAEMKEARAKYPDAGNSAYEYAFQRWNEHTFPRLDKAKTFAERGVNFFDKKAIETFMREAFDNLVNKGKLTQDGVNISKKHQQERVLHWKDAQSLVEYNSKFGSGSIQESIVSELGRSFGLLEVMRDWSVNPLDGLRATLKTAEENPKFKQRLDKGKQDRKLENMLKSMISRDSHGSGRISSITTNLLTAETVTKLGMALPSSIADLHNTASVASRLGKNRLQVYAGVLKNLVAGLSEAERKDLSSMASNAMAAKLGQVTKMFINPFKPGSWRGQAVHWAWKLNLMERWDNANNDYIASVTAEHFGNLRNTSWGKLKPSQRDYFGEYNIGEHEWEAIRQSSVKTKTGKFITPDSIHDVPNDKLKVILEGMGVKNPSDTRIQMFKDEIDRKMSTLFRNNQEYSITTPNPSDRSVLPGSSVTAENNPVLYNALRIGLQFKHFGVGLFRRTVLKTLRARGATTNFQAVNPFSGKFNWVGMGVMATELVTLQYAGMALKNLAVGLSPPDLTKPQVWKDMVKKSMGIMELAFQIDPKNPQASVGGLVMGAVGSDFTKMLQLGFNFSKETGEDMGYEKTAKSSYQLIKNLVPANTVMTRWLMNHFFLNQFEDWAAPGKRESDLQEMTDKTGARQIF